MYLVESRSTLLRPGLTSFILIYLVKIQMQLVKSGFQLCPWFVYGKKRPMNMSNYLLHNVYSTGAKMEFEHYLMVYKH